MLLIINSPPALYLPFYNFVFVLQLCDPFDEAYPEGPGQRNLHQAAGG